MQTIRTLTGPSIYPLTRAQSVSLLPRRLLPRAREHRYRLELVQATADRLLVGLPAHTCVMVHERTLAEGISSPSRLGCEARCCHGLLARLLLLRLLDQRLAKVLGERIGARRRRL